MGPNALARAGFVSLLLGLAACGGKQDEATDTIDLAAIRARRDSAHLAATQDSAMRARYTTCSDSVQAALIKAAHGKKPKPGAPAGMIPPEVLQTCGKPPAAQVAMMGKTDSAIKTTAAKMDTALRTAAAKVDTAAKKAESGVTAGASAVAPRQDPAARVEAPAKPALTPKQIQVMRADSIRLAKERARQDSLQQLADRARQDSVAKAQRDSVRTDSLRIARETEVQRETFTYAGGARDPFASLISEDKVGPEFNDLLLVGVYLDLRRANNSVAVLRDKTNQKRYKLRVGDRLGRLKVAQIRQTDVVFTVEDIGFERQETLSLRKREEQTP
ncbi:MAG: hypothetical protein ABI742_10885 [Gemmatimonadota bacterium]